MASDRQTLLNPVRELIEEHAIFMRSLEALVTLTESLSTQGEVVDSDVIEEIDKHHRAVDEHLNVHFVKEEEIFFPAIERLFPSARVKFQFLHVDHDRLRETFELFTEMLQHARHGRLARRNRVDLSRLASEMVRLFYYHIVAEDVVYLDVAATMLTQAEAANLSLRMHALEDRLRERCSAVDGEPKLHRS